MRYNAYEIGQRARAARNNKNIMQKELSEILGIAQSTYSKFENGEYDIPLSELIRLCDYLGISASWLIGEKGFPHLTDYEALEIETFMQFLISKRRRTK